MPRLDRDRRRIPLWPLLPALIIVLLLLRREDPVSPPPPAAAPPTAAPVPVPVPVAARSVAGDVSLDGGVARFVEWAEHGGADSIPAGSDEARLYTAEGVRLLADALAAATSARGLDRAAQIDSFRLHADGLRSADTLAPGATHAAYAAHAHSALAEGARLIAELAGDADPQGLVARADRVRPGQPLDPQLPRVRAFFRQAAAALSALDAPAAR